MFWKKNVFSYVLWLALAAVTVSGLYGLIANMTSSYQMPLYADFLISIAYCLVAYALMFFVRNLIEEKFYKVHMEKKTILLLECLGFLFCIALGVTVRLLELDGKITDSYYFRYAKVGEKGGVPPFVHGAGYINTWLLRFLCMTFGNQILNGAILQLCLCGMAFVCFYFTVRLSAGRLPAFFAFFVGMCATYMRKNAMTLSPVSLILLLIAILSLFLAVANKKKAAFIWYLPIGLLTGVCGYLDCLCFLPLVFFLVLNVKEEEMDAIKDRLIRLVGFLTMTVVGFAVMFFGDMLLSGSTIGRILWAYTYANGNGESSVLSLTLECRFVVEMMVFFALLVFASVSFMLDKHKERISGWALILLVLLVAQALGVGNQNVDINVLLMVYGAVLCGIGVSAFWNFERLPIRQSELIISSEAAEKNGKKSETSDNTEEKATTDSQQRYSFKIDPPEGVSMEDVAFIENPLPLPKKHVSKNLDYDIEVADDDDFDI